jgi:predicted nucleotidyltransferase
MNMDIDEIKKQVICSFLPFEPDKIILFGSITRDDWDKHSDVDVIVVYETDKSFLERLKELYMSWNVPKAIDILAYTPAEFIEMAAENIFIQDAVKDGELIYERG